MSPGAAPRQLLLELSRVEKAADPYAFQPTRQEYRRRAEDGTYRSATFPWGEPLERDLAELELPTPDRARVQRLGDTLRSFLVELGWEEDELHLRQAVEAGLPVHLICRFAAAELYALPWELVTLSPTRQHLGELPGCSVQYEWPGSRTAPPLVFPPPEGGRLLFACSADVPADLHLRALREASARSRYPFDPKRDALSHVSLAGLAEALAASPEPVAALHILCHGTRTASGAYGLAWHPSGPLGQVEVLDAGALRQALGAHARRIRMVVLCACSGAGPGPPGSQLGSAAQALHQMGIPAVVAFRFPISKAGSLRLTEVLYGELLGGTDSLQQTLAAARVRLAQEFASLDWASLQLFARAEDGTDVRPFVLRPFRGLLAFEPHHRRFFFGREALQQVVVERIRHLAEGARPRFLAVAGASGSGKSSLVMAGVAPALDPEAWEIRIMRPGNAVALAEAQRWARPGRRLLLVVDQLEEAFTRIRDAGEREAFFQKLWALASRPEPAVVVVATLRVDHFERCGEISLSPSGPRLDAVVYDEEHRLFVPQMEPEHQAAIIQGPVEAVGLKLEEGLVERLCQDVGQEPGALPLLEHALDLLWQEREGRRLTHRAYEAMGGVTGSLTRTVEAVYKGFTPRQRFRLRRLMVELVDLRDAAAPETRRRVWRDQVRPSRKAARRTFDSVVDVLVDRRLVIRGGDADAPGAAVWIEIAHEALIRQWKRLRIWIRKDRERSTQLRELSAWSEAWRSHREAPDGGASYLLTGDRLGYARRLREEYAGDVSMEAARFIDASAERAEAERLKEERARSRLRRLTTGLAALLGLASVFAAVAYQQRGLANARATEAVLNERQSRAQVLLGAGDPGEAALLLLEVGQPVRVREWMALAQETLQQPIEEVVLRHPEPVREAKFSPDGKLVATVCRDGMVRVWGADGRSGPILLRGHRGAAHDFQFSPDGTRVLAASGDGRVRVWRTDGAGEPLVLVDPPGHVAPPIFGRDGLQPRPGAGAGAPGNVPVATFSRDGKRIAIEYPDGRVRVWNADGSGDPLQLTGQTDGGRGLVFSPDGTRLLSGSFDGTARLWDLASARELMRFEGPPGEPLSFAIFSPDGRFVLTGGNEGVARLWDLNGKPVAVMRGHTSSVWAGAFSTAGERVVTCSLDGTARVWNLKGEQEAVLKHTQQVWSAVFSPDGERIVTASSDRTARLWSRQGKELLVLRGPEGEVWRAYFDPKGERVVTASSDRTARIWRVDREGEQVVLRRKGDVVSAELSPDGRRVLTASEGAARIWSAGGSGAPLVLAAKDEVMAVAFSPDGTKVAGVTQGGAAHVWSAADASELLVQQTSHGPLRSVGYSPDGSRIVAASDDGAALIFRTDRRAEPVVLSGHGAQCRFAAFSPDGSLVVTTSNDRTARLWKTGGSGEPVVLEGHEGLVTSAAFSPDGARVATASEDGTARVWWADRRAPPVVLRGGLREEHVMSVAFSPDGTRIVTSSTDGKARVWRSDGSGSPMVLAHGGEVWSSVFSPDGQWVLTASLDLTARLWRAADGEEIAQLRGHTGWIRRASFSADGQWAVTASTDGTARVWPLTVPLLQEQLRKASSACLSVEHREAYLGEPEAQARQRYEACERSYGRLP